MSTPSLPPRRGAHRARADLARAVVPSVLAVAVVAAILTGLVLWRGEPADDPVDATGDAGVVATTSAAPSATSAPATQAPRPAPTVSGGSEDGPTGTPTGEPTDEASEEPAGRDAEVVVLNQTARGGLAARVADALRGDGWTVATTGNFRGTVPATTVYYPSGQEDAAALLAADLPGPDRIRPRFSNLSQTRLTVVLTDDYEQQ